MPKRPGMADLATAARVSIATVDRALNGREPVHAATYARIVAAALRIGHPAAALLSPATPDLPALRLGVVLHKGGQAFYQDFTRALTAVAALEGRAQVDLTVAYANSQAPAEMAALLRSMIGRCDVVAATAVNHPEITAAVTALKAAGVPVIALLSDFAEGIRAAYLGVDNLKAGRVAGWITALAAKGPGKVAVFIGGHRWHGHDLRDTGFRAYLREHAPRLVVMDSLINLETRALTFEATLALLAREPNLRGIYVAGGGMEGAIAALTEARAPGEVALVVNELTDASRAGLAGGWVTLVAATPLAPMMRLLLDMAVSAAHPVASQTPAATLHLLQPVLHVREML
jgi:LacI family transcriptional regulator